jgi:hypothetical protein
MGWVNARTWTTGEVVTAAQLNQDVRDNPQYLKDNTNNPQFGCRVSNTVAQTIGTGSWIYITFDADRWDVGGCHDTDTNTHRLVAPGTGKYLVTANLAFEPNATGFRGIEIVDDGGIVEARVLERSDDASQQLILTVSAIVLLSAASWVAIRAFQSSGGDLDVQKNTNWSPEAGLVKVMT